MDRTLIVEQDIGSDIERLLKGRCFVAHLESEFKRVWIAEETRNLQKAGLPQPVIDFMLRRYDSCIKSAILSGVEFASGFTERMMNGDMVAAAAVVAIREECESSKAAMRANAAMYKASESAKL